MVQWGEFREKNATLCLNIFFAVFCCFSSKKCYLFNFFFYEVSNIRNRIWTNQKLELVIGNCQYVKYLPKATDFCLLLKIMSKNIAKNKSKNVSSKYSQKLLIMLNNLLQIHLKLFQKEKFKKQQKQLVIWLVIKLLIKLLKSQEFRIGQKEMIAIC